MKNQIIVLIEGNRPKKIYLLLIESFQNPSAGTFLALLEPETKNKKRLTQESAEFAGG
jgi:hypothetical protein